MQFDFSSSCGSHYHTSITVLIFVEFIFQLSSEAPDVLVVPTTSRTNGVNVENPGEINDISTQVTVETTPSTSVHRSVRLLLYSFNFIKVLFLSSVFLIYFLYL